MGLTVWCLALGWSPELPKDPQPQLSAKGTLPHSRWHAQKSSLEQESLYIPRVPPYLSGTLQSSDHWVRWPHEGSRSSLGHPLP